LSYRKIPARHQYSSERAQEGRKIEFIQNSRALVSFLVIVLTFLVLIFHGFVGLFFWLFLANFPGKFGEQKDSQNLSEKLTN